MLYTQLEEAVSRDGRRYWVPGRLPDVQLGREDLLIEVKSGERLDILAHRHYNDVSFWVIIAHVNALPTDTLMVSVGTLLRIPQTPNLFR